MEFRYETDYGDTIEYYADYDDLKEATITLLASERGVGRKEAEQIYFDEDIDPVEFARENKDAVREVLEEKAYAEYWREK